MKRINGTRTLVSAAALSMVIGLCGCWGMSPLKQTMIGGQTLPSAHYLKDDVQYFPPGPETPLTETRKAYKEYNVNQQALPGY